MQDCSDMWTYVCMYVLTTSSWRHASLEQWPALSSQLLTALAACYSVFEYVSVQELAVQPHHERQIPVTALNIVNLNISGGDHAMWYEKKLDQQLSSLISMHNSYKYNYILYSSNSTNSAHISSIYNVCYESNWTRQAELKSNANFYINLFYKSFKYSSTRVGILILATTR